MCPVPRPGTWRRPADAEWLAAAIARVGEAAPRPHHGRPGHRTVADAGLHASAVVIGPDGGVAGVQDKVQVDPSEDGLYAPGEGRRVFDAGGVTFGVTICHEGWRYPETVRWAARRGAQVVFHQAFHEAEPGGLPAQPLCRSGQHVSREGRPLSRGGEHVLRRDGQLCRRGIADDIGGGAARRHAPVLPAVRGCRRARRRSRSRSRDGSAGEPVPLRLLNNTTRFRRDA